MDLASIKTNPSSLTMDIKKEKILVVDDEAVIQDLLAKMLKKQGYEVSIADDGVQALGKIKQTDFDLVIMDLKMPRMGGMELLREIKKLKKDCIIIAVTGYATIDTVKEAIQQGCFDYITKPFNVEAVEHIIRRAFEMRRLERQKKQLQEQLEVTQRLSLIGELGAGVAHEVNTVLTSTKLFLEIISPQLSGAPEEKNIRVVLEELARVEKLIARFLSFTKPAEYEFTNTDINDVIIKTLKFLDPRLDKSRIKVKGKYGQNIPKVLCDAAQMKEAFLNIFSNSIDAMPDGGQLAVKSELAADNVLITISDSGRGIPPKKISKIYNPFFTTKAKGTGLGLSIVHRIIDRHNGVISIDSAPGKGTTIQLALQLNRPGKPAQ